MNKGKKDTSINVGNISNMSGGQINIAGKDIHVSQSNAPIDEVAGAFATIMKAINRMPEGSEKDIAQSALQGLKTEARKGERVNESNVKKWLRFLTQTAPDAFDVAIDTFVHPIKGIHTIFQKIAKQMKQNRD